MPEAKYAYSILVMKFHVNFLLQHNAHMKENFGTDIRAGQNGVIKG
jgi:glucuronate isomerase